MDRVQDSPSIEKRKRTPSVRLTEIKSSSRSTPNIKTERKLKIKRELEIDHNAINNDSDEENDFFLIGGIFDDEGGLSNIVLEDLEFSYDGVEWYASHLDPRVILWSSHPEVLAPTVQIKLPIPADARPGIGNMFLVTAPAEICSDACRWNTELDSAAESIRTADAVLIIAGAGMGVDSGLPDYRGPNGFWTAYPALAQLGVSMEEMSSTKWFLQAPLFAWGFYAHRTQLYSAAIPHEGFAALLELVQKLKAENYFIFTSNIDSQFQKAGFSTDRIYECHGSLQQLQCAKATRKNRKCATAVWPLQPTAVPEVDQQTLKCKNLKSLPRCGQCGGIARPNVSMFGDTDEIFADSRTHTQKRALVTWLRQLTGKKVAVLELGCGTSIHSLRIEADALLQRRKNTTLIRVNPVDFRSDIETPFSSSSSSLLSLPSVESNTSGSCLNGDQVNSSCKFIGIGMGAKSALLELRKRCTANSIQQ